MTAGGVEQYVILAFSSKEGQEKCTSFAILSLTLGPGDAYDPAALGRLGPGGAMTLRSARGLVALAVVFASIGAGFWLHAIWTTSRGPHRDRAGCAGAAPLGVTRAVRRRSPPQGVLRSVLRPPKPGEPRGVPSARAGVGGHRGLAGLRPHQLPRHQGCRRCHRPAQLEA